VGTDPGLRILILSTPKTGNTWLRHLLAGEYRLPQFYVPPPLDCAKLDKAGERWVTHYHIRPNPELLSWIRTNRAVVITTIRHPGDVLLSLYDHAHDFRNETLNQDFLRRMLWTGFARNGMTTYAANQPFSADLDCSLEWMACEGTHTVRYEDLRADPVAALREFTTHSSGAAGADRSRYGNVRHRRDAQHGGRVLRFLPPGARRRLAPDVSARRS